ncbi:conserved hypothetical protein [Aspergillus udagawae]|uniref:Uncharacterized protein n=1 Tax=Aspergillus udagawae TaxID=91492 RepID=A0ABQ1BC75_9EURO|nr:conserved hypothetical protein [Aspergillus udagawae]GFF98247.1 conserved hypothetical protein [Aspergillus udagawae]GFG10558.1 conserved hypothetical protein [Aspergillus udagawae]
MHAHPPGGIFEPIAYIEGLQGGDVMAEHEIHEIYVKVQAAPGFNAIVSPTVVAASRNASGILLVAMPQTAANMPPLGIDLLESSVFG